MKAHRDEGKPATVTRERLDVVKMRKTDGMVCILVKRVGEIKKSLHDVSPINNQDVCCCLPPKLILPDNVRLCFSQELLRSWPEPSEEAQDCSRLPFIDDIKRFKSAKELCGYAGLAPWVQQSNQTVHYGSITKHGPSELRKALVQMALGLDPELTMYLTTACLCSVIQSAPCLKTPTIFDHLGTRIELCLSNL